MGCAQILAHSVYNAVHIMEETSFHLGFPGSGYHCCALGLCSQLCDIFPLTRDQTQASTRRDTSLYSTPPACHIHYCASPLVPSLLAVTRQV